MGTVIREHMNEIHVMIGFLATVFLRKKKNQIKRDGRFHTHTYIHTQCVVLKGLSIKMVYNHLYILGGRHF